MINEREKGEIREECDFRDKEREREREKGGVRNDDFAWTQGGWAVHY